ncbi:MAG: PQQ-dependent sugar dehydrogenase [Synechococcus sp.]
MRIEAESMSLVNYTVTGSGIASGGAYADLLGQVPAGGSGTATYTFDGPDGTYDIVVGYYDEADGNSPWSVAVDGTEIDSWVANSTSGNNNVASAASFRTRTIVNQQLTAGQAIAVTGTRDVDEFARLDYIEFIQPISRFFLQDSGKIFVNEAAGEATITAFRSGSTEERITLEYTTNNAGGIGSAEANVDYETPTFGGTANTGQIVFESGESEKSFTVPIINDTLGEVNEIFSVGIQNPSGGTLDAPRTVLIEILDDDAPTTISVNAASIAVSEGTATANLTVQRTGNINGTSSVEFSTVDGTAFSGEDYEDTSGTITFAAQESTQTISIPILNDPDIEPNETFLVRLSNPTDAILGSENETEILISDNDGSLGDLTRQTYVSGLTLPTTLKWTPDGNYMLVAEKAGIVRVIENGVLRETPLINISDQVNETRDRGLIGLAIHPEFPTNPYVYLAYTYDPPETAGKTGLDGPDQKGNRPSRVAQFTVDPVTMIADPSSLEVILGTNSVWEYISSPEGNSTGDNSIPPSGIVNGTTIVAPPELIDEGMQDNDPDRPGIQNQNIRDFLATDSESHSIGDLEFGQDGYLYVSNGDGISYNFADPRGVRVQDINNLSGKVLKIDPLTGAGAPGNPFYEEDDPFSNQSKVYHYGMRNPYRIAIDPLTDRPIVGDVGWFKYEEINAGEPGANFGWPYIDGPEQNNPYSDLDLAQTFYNNGNRNDPDDPAAVAPILYRNHDSPDFANAITMGDFYDSNTLVYSDLNGGEVFAATLGAGRQITNVQQFDSDANRVVDIRTNPQDGQLYGVDILNGSILNWA